MREGLRVVEEYFRFIKNNEQISISLKELRHSILEIEKLIGTKQLVSNRDTDTDCFSTETRPEEMVRSCEEDIVIAGFKRSQEAARVLEEYCKIIDCSNAVSIAKTIRFSLYKIEKNFLEITDHE